MGQNIRVFYEDLMDNGTKQSKQALADAFNTHVHKSLGIAQRLIPYVDRRKHH